MPLRMFNGYTTTNVTIPTSVETVVNTVPGVSTDQPGRRISFSAAFTITLGVGTTGVTGRVRLGSLTGAVIGESVADVIETAAGSIETHTVDVVSNNPGEFVGRDYVLTVEQIGATGDGVINQSSISATIL